MPSQLKIAEGHQAVMPYLLVKDARGLIAFMKTVFDAEETYRSLRPDGSIRHVQMSHHGSTIMLGGTGSDFSPRPAGMFIYVEDTDATYQKAIAAGAEKVLEPFDADYADRAAGVLDPFGNTWWLATIK